MTKTIIELFYDTDDNGELIQAGNPDVLDAYNRLENHIVAIEHNMNSGISSTLYRVDGDANQSDIDEVVNAYDWHKDWGIDRGIIRGIEIQPGTPTDTEADDLAQRILDAGGPDLTVEQPSYEPSVHIYNDLPDDALEREEPSWSKSIDQGAGGPGPVESDTDPNKSVIDVIKEDFPSIPDGKWRCLHPDHDAPEMVDTGSTCSLGHTDDRMENEYAQQKRRPFDPTTFL